LSAAFSALIHDKVFYMNNKNSNFQRFLQILVAIGLLQLIMISNIAAQGDAPVATAPATPLTEAQAALEKRDWAQAELILNGFIKTEPKNPFGYFELARLYENTNRIQAAKNIYQAIAAIPEAEKSNFFVIGIKNNKKHISLLPDLAKEKLNALNGAALIVTTESTLPAAAPITTVAAAKATPSAATTPTASAEDAAVSAMRQWLAAWQSKSMDAYFASYVDGYKGDMRSSSQWKKSRTEKITGKTNIAIKVDNVAVTSLDSKQAQVTFTQTYTSNSFVDTTQKTLLMVNQAGNWLIAKESAK